MTGLCWTGIVILAFAILVVQAAKDNSKKNAQKAKSAKRRK